MQLLIDDHLKFRNNLRQLLTAQVLQGDHIDKVEEAQKDARERVDALILIVDDLIRRRPA